MALGDGASSLGVRRTGCTVRLQPGSIIGSGEVWVGRVEDQQPISRIVAGFRGKPPTLAAALRSGAAALLILIYHRSAWPTSSPKLRTFPTRHVTDSPKPPPRRLAAGALRRPLLFSASASPAA